MSSANYIFTSESVSEGHPDKVCDLISDSILDAYLSQDPESRVAVETMAADNYVVIAGEVRSKADLRQSDIEEIVRQVIKEIGYEQERFHWQYVPIDIRLNKQSPDIAQGVDTHNSKEEGAGDQGIMFGYACRETNVLMPAPIHYAHKILQSLAQARHSKKLAMLRPDAKSQVSLNYKDGVPISTHSIVVSTQHEEGYSSDQIKELIRPFIQAQLPKGWMCEDEMFFVNPTGRFVIGGPEGDCGLTGRKIIVDTYGGAAPHGGGAFSGKDPTKVDRSAAYIARYLAKNIVAADLADRCAIQLSYAIGVARPISIFVNCYGTGKVDERLIENILPQIIDLSPKGIRTCLHLNQAIYARTASYGHFGRQPTSEGHFSWEKTDLVDRLKAELL